MWRASTVLYSPTIVVAMLVLTAAVVAASPTTIEASPAVRNDSGIDLAGMALRPTDLEAAGLRDYGRTNGIMTNDPRVAADFLKGYRGDAEGATGIGLEAADPERAYVLNLVQPGTPGNPLSGTARRVVSYILAFQDAAAAEAAFPVLATAWQRGGMRAQPTAVAVGDDRVFVAGSGREERGNRSQYDRVDLLFRIQDLVTGVSVEDYVETPRQALVEALAERQAARVEDILGGDGPGLSQQIVRLRVPGENAISDGYAIVDAEPLRAFDETAAAFDARRATPAGSGMVDQYLLEQQVLGTLSSSERPLAFYVMHLTRFVDEDGASAYLRGAADRLAQGGREDVKEVPGAPDLGDGTAAFTYRHTRPDGVTFDDYRIYVRNGSDVFSMAFNTTEALEPAGVDGLAALQLACLEGTACLDPIPVPATLDRSMKPQGSAVASTSPAP